MDPQALRNMILQEMKRGPTSLQQEKPIKKKYKRLDDVIDPSSEDSIKNLLNEQAKAEIEVSFGTYRVETGKEDNFGFSPGLLSAYQFESLRSDLSKITNPKIYNDRTEIMEGVFIRKIVNLDIDENAISYQKKFRPKDSFISNKIWGYRISKSLEENTEEPEFEFRPSIIRYRRRHSYIIRDSDSNMHGFRFDLSHIKEVKMKEVKVKRMQTEEESKVYDPSYGSDDVEPKMITETKMVEDRSYIKYEVEIERLSSVAATKNIPIENLRNAIKFVLFSIQNVNKTSDLLTLEEIRDVVGGHNSLFSEDIKRSGAKMSNPYMMFKDYWNKPTNIGVEDLLYKRVDDMSVTVKLDGIRQFIFITNGGVFSLGPPTDIYRIDTNTFNLEGTLLDTERYTDNEGNECYYAFDILFNKGVSVRSAKLKERLSILDNVLSAISLGKKTNDYNIKKKHFYTKGTIYEKTTEALNWIENNPDFLTDGLIFQPSHYYKNEHTKKWKYSNQMTIDFMFKKRYGEDIDENSFDLYVSDKKGDVKFEGSFRHPYDTFVIVEDGLFDGTPVDGSIVECKWDSEEKNFVPYRIRLDRDRPNAYNTARDVWRDIMDPITRKDIEGDSVRVLRRYHNTIKYNTLKSELDSGSIIMDWGSGRGGDLNKWADLSFKKVYVVEPNEKNLEELERRKEQMKDQKNSKNLEIHICRDPETGELLGGQDTEKLVEVVKEKLDAVVSFFSLTFFGSDEDKWESMLNSFDNLLEEGGKVIGIVMDGKRTKELLEQARRDQNLPEEEAVDYLNKSFTISQLTEFTDSEVGNEIEIKIHEESSMVRGDGESGGQIEWLFYFDHFKKRMEDKGFSLYRSGFLDADPKEKTEFDVLPPDSKVFSKLNRYFVFTRKSKGQRLYKSATQLNSLQPEEMTFFTTLDLEDGGKAELHRIGTIKDPSNFFHAIIRSFDQSYYDMNESDKKARIKKIRGMLGRKLTKEKYLKLNDGELASKYTYDAMKEMVSMGNKTPDEINAKEIGFLEYRLRLMDSSKNVSAETGLELLSVFLGVNIIMLKANGMPILKLHGNRDCDYMMNKFYTNEKTILVVSPDGVHYDLIANVIEGKKGPDVYTVFQGDSKIINTLLNIMCE